jgi:hypothetical protein
MITFSQLGKYGAIGNQLFQYATLYSIAKINNYTVKIPNTAEHFDDGTKRIQHYFLNCFDNIKADILNEDDLMKVRHRVNWGFPAIFNENLFKIPDDTDIEGYFQSYKFFEKFKGDILDQLNFKSDIKESISEKYNFDLVEFSSVHLRYGDYAGRDYHHPIMNENYYEKAFAIINKDKYLVFSDTIEKAKEIFSKFKDIHFIYIENNHCFEDLLLMSLCKNNIIANSSFSWWGAYINKNQPKIVAPRNWLGPAYNGQWRIDDLIPKEWSII